MSLGEQPLSFSELGMPTHQELVTPVLRAVEKLGGSAKAREITENVIDEIPNADHLLEMTYPARPTAPVLPDRISWGRSTAKLIGALKQPSRGVYILTNLGEELLAATEEDALLRVKELDRIYNREQRLAKQPNQAIPDDEIESEDPSPEVLAESIEDDTDSSAT